MAGQRLGVRAVRRDHDPGGCACQHPSSACSGAVMPRVLLVGGALVRL